MKIGPVEQDWTAFSTLEAQILNFVCGRVLHEVPPVKNRLSEEADRITVTCLDSRLVVEVKSRTHAGALARFLLQNAAAATFRTSSRRR